MPEIPTPMPSVPPEVPKAPEAGTDARPYVHTLESDLNRVMNATDATTVQEMFAAAREKEDFEKDEAIKQHKRTLLSRGAVLFILLAIIAVGFSIWHFTHLTVPVEEKKSVGVFPLTESIIASQAPFTDALRTLQSSASLVENRPSLVPIYSDTPTGPVLQTPLQLLQYVGAATTPEPLIISFDTLRLGMVRIGNTITPFLIGALRDPETGTKELQNTEPQMMELFGQALAIDPQLEHATTFTSTYRYNIPIRILEHIHPETQERVPTMLYGYPTDSIVVITTNPLALKAIYDTIISQY